MPKASVRDQIASFENQAATLMAGFATEASVSKSGLEDNLRRIGVAAKVTATGSAVKVDVQVPEHPGFRTGEAPEDFTQAARDRRAEEHFASRKSAVWKAVKAMTGITSEQKVEALRKLGYGEKNLPSQKTQVMAEVTDSSGYNRSLSFTLDGEHTEAEVRERLEASVEHSPATTVILAAFPEAVLPDSAKKVPYLSVSAQLTWPAEYTA